MRHGESLRGDHLDWLEIEYRPAVPAMYPTLLLPHVQPGQRALEIGCGTGSVAVYLAEHGLTVEGIDLNFAAISEAASRARDAGVSERAHFVCADFTRGDFQPEPADVVVLIRTLTCFPQRSAWLTVLNRSLASIVSGGLLYVRDFLLTDDVYGSRYQDGLRRGLAYGNFVVPSSGDNLMFVAHHHNESDLKDITAGLTLLSARNDAGLSMNGNRCQMFEIIARKP